MEKEARMLKSVQLVKAKDKLLKCIKLGLECILKYNKIVLIVMEMDKILERSVINVKEKKSQKMKRRLKLQFKKERLIIISLPLLEKATK